MNAKRLLDAIGLIDDVIIDEAAKVPKKKNKLVRLGWAAAAACVVIAAIAALPLLRSKGQMSLGASGAESEVGENGAYLAEDSTAQDFKTGVSEADGGAYLTLHGKIVKTAESGVLVAGENDVYEIARGALSNYTDEELKPGTVIETESSGDVLTTWPARIESVSYVGLMPGDDLVGLYLKAVDDLWNDDKALNENTEYIAFDLSEAQNLTEGEKSAMRYLASQRYGAEPLEGTIDELTAQGYISDGRFESGLLFEFYDMEFGDSGFWFNAGKWRSGTAGIHHTSCEAVLSENKWSYSFGGTEIS